MSRYSMTLGRYLPAEKGESRLRAAFLRFADRFMAAQQARAEHMVRPYLARVPEEDLKILGYTPEEIARLRKERSFPDIRTL